MQHKKLPAFLIGTGSILFIINQPGFILNQYILISNIGLILIYLGILFTLPLIKNVKELSLGSRWVWIPLVIITLSMIISVVLSDLPNKMSLILFAPTLFGLYVLSRYLGGKIFVPFVYGVVIASLSMVVYHFINPGVKTGGIISITNYDIATGFLVFGAFVSVFRHQWYIVICALTGLLLTGADEALFSITVMGAFIFFREVMVISKKGIKFNFNEKVYITFAFIILLLAVGLKTGIAQSLYQPALDKIQALFNGDLYAATNERLGTGGNLNILPLKLFGNGYFVSWDDSYRFQIPHNVPIIVADQIGIVGALAWCVVTGYCLIKTKLKYAWVAVLSLCVFDHYVWSQAGIYWWILIGVSTSVTIKNDKLFK